MPRKANAQPAGGGGGGWAKQNRSMAENRAKRANARTSRQDLMRGEHVVGNGGRGLTWHGGKSEASQKVLLGKAGAGPGGTLWRTWTSHPRFYEQKTAAEARLGRELSTEEFGRDYFIIPDSEIVSGTSIFDPVLCELAYRWFCPPSGLVLDPFAGGSVRGIVASKLGRQYLGIDLRPEQLAANQAQAAAICGAPQPRWIEGDARDLDKLVDGTMADFVFSCPPYGDLERYSDDPRDLSTMAWTAFLGALREIIAAAVAHLKPDRFACFVVGDIRDRNGYYRGLPWRTVEAFEDAGARLYNEAVLVTAVGSLPIRVAKQFESSRKLGKTHQNVLVFCKGSARKATAAVGPIEFGEIEEPPGEGEWGEKL